MANFAISYYVTDLGTHVEVQAELERVVESLVSPGTAIYLLGINEVSRDRDESVGFLLCDEVLWVQGASHDHVVPNLTITEV
jgi:hypothetical protein